MRCGSPFPPYHGHRCNAFRAKVSPWGGQQWKKRLKTDEREAVNLNAFLYNVFLFKQEDVVLSPVRLLC